MKKHGSNRLGHKVTPRSIKEIRKIAEICHDVLTPVNQPSVDMVTVLESILPTIAEDFVLETPPIDVLGDIEGRTIPNKLVIQLREDVYIKMHEGDERAKFTAAHELGHLILHQNIPLNFENSLQVHAPYEDSEWQADIFAAEFLMPIEKIKHCRNATEIAELCKVSPLAAFIRFKRLRMEGYFRSSLA